MDPFVGWWLQAASERQQFDVLVRGLKVACQFSDAEF
jgi:hypothetical protein